MGKLPPVEPANVAELTQILKHGKQPEGKDAVVRYENKSFVDIADEALDALCVAIASNVWTQHLLLSGTRFKSHVWLRLLPAACDMKVLFGLYVSNCLIDV